MSDKRLDFVIYLILTAVISIYMIFNVFIPAAAGPAAVEPGGGALTENPDMEPEAGSHAINQKGYHLFIDLDRVIMYVYRDGRLLRTYPVSGGKPSTPSPVGTWIIISKDTWGDGFGGAWLGFNVPWGLFGIHGTTEPWFVGNSNTSKGCIRMKNKDLHELYEMVPYGAIVTIVHDTRPFYPMRDGNIGSDVLEVEKALRRLGYYNGSEDGIFGEALESAVRKFQKDYRLYNTGVVNISTYELIMQLDRELQEKREAKEKHT